MAGQIIYLENYYEDSGPCGGIFMFCSKCLRT